MLVTMTDKELYRLGIIQRVFDRALLQRDAADILKLSVRQVQRLVRLYRTDGATAFASSRGFVNGMVASHLLCHSGTINRHSLNGALLS